MQLNFRGVANSIPNATAFGFLQSFLARPGRQQNRRLSCILISSVSEWLPASDSRSANHSLDSRVASRQSTMSDVVADSGGAGRYVVTRRTAVSNDVAMPTEGSASTPTSSIHDPAHDIKAFRRLFHRVYKNWSRSDQPVDEEDMAVVTSVNVSEEDFLKLTETRQLGKYIALIDYRIRFDELPLPPHGEIISYMSDYLSGVFQTGSAANVLFGAADNGMASSILNSQWQMCVSSLVPSNVRIYRIEFDPERFPTTPQVGCDFLQMGHRTRTWWLRLL